MSDSDEAHSDRDIPRAPKLPAVESPPPEEVLENVPSKEEVIEGAPAVDEVIEKQRVSTRSSAETADLAPEPGSPQQTALRGYPLALARVLHRRLARSRGRPEAAENGLQPAVVARPAAG
jgi:hypothetical protein